MNDALDGGPVTVTVSGLPTGLYNVYTYAWYPANSISVISAVTVNGLSSQNVQRTGLYAGFVLGETHALHTVSITSPQTLTIDAAVGNIVAVINGFQIITIPEPTSMSLVIVGAACWAVTVRRRRKT